MPWRNVPGWPKAYQGSSGIQTLQDEFLYNLGIGIPPVSNRRQVTHCGANKDISPLLKQSFHSSKRG